MATETGTVRLIRPEERSGDAQPTAGMTREESIVSPWMWAGCVRPAPNMASGWHYRGEYETAIYVLKGSLKMEFGAGGAQAVEARPGDFVHVPAGTIHRESNPGSEEGAVLVVRAPSNPPLPADLLTSVYRDPSPWALVLVERAPVRGVLARCAAA